jgi:hypothetical protein
MTDDRLGAFRRDGFADVVSVMAVSAMTASADFPSSR